MFHLVKAFIFDMDGVIIDSEPIHNKVLAAKLTKYNIPTKDINFDKFIGMASTEVFSHFIVNYQIPHTAEELTLSHMQEFKDYLCSHKLQAIEGIIPLLDELKSQKIALAIASSSPLDIIKHVVKSFNIDDYFQVLVSGEDLPQSKPAPDIYLDTARKLNVLPEECVVLEDSKNGSIAAKKAGMFCIGFKNLNSGNQDLSYADICVNKISDINIKTLP